MGDSQSETKKHEHHAVSINSDRPEEEHDNHPKKRPHNDNQDMDALHAKKRRNSKQFLSSTTMGDFIKWRAQGDNQETNKQLIYANSTESVRAAVQLLRDHNILSVPVWDNEEKTFIWFLSILDVLRFCMTDGERADSSKTPYEFSLRDMIPTLGEDESGMVQTVMKSSSLSSVMEWFTLGVHRVLVQDDNATTDQPSGFVVSQSDVVRYLYHHDKDLSKDADQTIEEHGFLKSDAPSIGPKKLISIESSKSALEGFQLLFVNRTNAVAVVDSEGKLVGNLSASDLRGVKATEVEQLLSTPVLDFLKTQSHTALVVCKPSSTLRQVIHMLVEQRVHRLWVVDDNHHMVGLVTLTDIVCKFAPFDYKLLHSDKI